MLGWLLLFLPGTALPGESLQGPGEEEDQNLVIESPSPLEIDQARGVLRGGPGTTITFPPYGLQAGEIIWNFSEQTVLAGDPFILQSPRGRLVGRQLTLDFSEGSLEGEDLRFGFGTFTGFTPRLEGSPERFQADRLRVFPAEPAPLSPFFELREAVIEADGQIEGSHLLLGVGRLPLLYWPRLKMGGPGLAPLMEIDAGNSSNLGTSLLLGLRVPVTPRLSPGADIHLFTRRGALVGPGLQYESLPQDPLWIRTDIRTGWIADQGSPGEDRSGQPIGRDRGFVEGRQQIDNHENWQAQAKVSYWSDSEITRDFRRDLFSVEENPDQFASGTWQGSWWQSHVFTRFRPNPFQRIPKRLPDVRLALLPSPWGEWLWRGEAKWTRLREHIPSGEQTPTGFEDLLRDTGITDRADLYSSIARSYSPSPWLVLTPSLGGRLTHYEQTLTGEENYTRLRGEMAMEMRSYAFGQWPTRSRTWNIDGLRHQVSPFLVYRWIPSLEEGRPRVAPIDRQPFLNRQPIYDLGLRTDLDDPAPTHLWRLGLDQEWETRDPEYGSRSLARIQVSQDWHASSPPRHGERLPPMEFDYHLHPASWISLRSFQRVAPRDGEITEWNNRLTLRDQGFWEFSLGNEFLDGFFEIYHLDLERRLNETYTLQLGATYDTRENQWTEKFVGLRQNLQNTWLLDYGVRFRQGNRRESSTSYTLRARLLAF